MPALVAEIQFGKQTQHNGEAHRIGETWPQPRPGQCFAIRLSWSLDMLFVRLRFGPEMFVWDKAALLPLSMPCCSKCLLLPLFPFLFSLLSPLLSTVRFAYCEQIVGGCLNRMQMPSLILSSIAFSLPPSLFFTQTRLSIVESIVSLLFPCTHSISIHGRWCCHPVVDCSQLTKCSLYICRSRN